MLLKPRRRYFERRMSRPRGDCQRDCKYLRHVRGVLVIACSVHCVFEASSAHHCACLSPASHFGPRPQIWRFGCKMSTSEDKIAFEVFEFNLLPSSHFTSFFFHRYSFPHFISNTVRSELALIHLIPSFTQLPTLAILTPFLTPNLEPLTHFLTDLHSFRSRNTT